MAEYLRQMAPDRKEKQTEADPESADELHDDGKMTDWLLVLICKKAGVKTSLGKTSCPLP